MKISSKILFCIAAALFAAFGIKNIINYASYARTINSAPFDVMISSNALFFVIPAAILAAIALCSERKTRVLAICAAIFAAVVIEELTRRIAVYHFAAADGLLLASPYIAAAVIFAVFVILSEHKNGGKTLSTALFVISGALFAAFIVMSLNQVIDRRRLDNVMQLVVGLIIYYVIFLIPAAGCITLAKKIKK